MKPRLLLPLTVLVCTSSIFAKPLNEPSAEEMQTRNAWVQKNFGNQAPSWPVSFRLGDKSSRDILASWKVERSERKIDEQRTELTLTATDPETQLSLRCVAVQYADFPVVEWTPYFKNNSGKDSPLISRIQALDADFQQPGPGEFVLDYAKGSDTAKDSFEPRQQTINGKKPEFRLNNFGGRASYRTWPYWKISRAGAGAVFALGWPGQWAADFKFSGGNALRVSAGQELTNFKLLPGEEVRAPLVDGIEGQCGETMSLALRSSSSDSTEWAPANAISTLGATGSSTRTRHLKGTRRRTTSRPIRPNPMIPTVRSFIAAIDSKGVAKPHSPALM